MLVFLVHFFIPTFQNFQTVYFLSLHTKTSALLVSALTGQKKYK